MEAGTEMRGARDKGGGNLQECGLEEDTRAFEGKD